MKIYLDTCCYCRPFDVARQSQTQVEVEAAIIENVVDLCNMTSIPIIGSAAIITELKNIRDIDKQKDVLNFYTSAVSENIVPSESIFNRTQELMDQGITNFDSAHIALAESVGVDYLLTVDDKLERAAARLKLAIKVINPLNFFEEIIKWAQSLT